MSWHEESEEHIAAAHAALRVAGIIVPVGQSPEETRLWLNHDLATFAEYRLGLAVDPLKLEEPLRTKLIGRATESGELYDPHARYAIPYWVKDGAETVGTGSLSLVSLGGRMLSLSSLHVRQSHRGHGYARRLLEAINAAAVREGLAGIELGTSWCWQPAVRFYCGISMWVRMWKRDLSLVWRTDLPRWSVQVAQDEAQFLIHSSTTRDQPGSPAIIARRDGTRLHWRELEPPEWTDEVPYVAPGTFALALAIRGWPLITSDRSWQEQCQAGFSDGGGPEGLAFKIVRWEAWDRRHGWRVETPRIPGLEYPSWEELYPDEED